MVVETSEFLNGHHKRITCSTYLSVDRRGTLCVCVCVCEGNPSLLLEEMTGARPQRDDYLLLVVANVVADECAEKSVVVGVVGIHCFHILLKENAAAAMTEA